MKKNLMISSVLLAALLGLSACGNPKQCLTQADCNACEDCNYGSCVQDPAKLNACGQCGELPAEACGDAVDNDCDGLTDEGCPDPCAGLDCNDNNPCTEGDHCADGACVPGTNVCDCTADADCVAHEDGDLCNGTLHCLDNACVVDQDTLPVPPTYTSSDCFEYLCNPETGLYDIKKTAENNRACDDLDDCTEEDACLDGTCIGEELVCQDNNPCTDDTCSAGIGCEFIDNTALCDDNNPCTEEDRCDSGNCVPGESICDCNEDADCSDQQDDDLCNGTLHCVEKKCGVDPETIIQCDAAQDSACQQNTCRPATGLCELDNINEDGNCDDANPCTNADTCQAGQCLGQSSDQCPADGATECRQGQIRSCLADDQGCLDWGAYLACPTGVCVDANTCENCPVACTAGEKECVGTGLKTCELQNNGCYDWSNPIACSFGANSYPSCVNDACTVACNDGYADCDLDPDTGCEIRTDTDLGNCGACAHACGLEGGSATCQTGVCAISCDSNRADCNGQNADGCEIWLEYEGKNCGYCGHDCLGGNCIDGQCRPVTLASGQASPARIVVDDNYVYWTNEGTDTSSYSDGAVKKVAKTGGSIQTLASGQMRAWGIAVDDSDVFFTNLGYSDVAYNYPLGNVSKVSKTGGSVSLLASSQPAPWSVLIVEGIDKVFWCNGGTYHVSNNTMYYDNNGSVWRATKSGGSPTALATGQQEPVALVHDGWYSNDEVGLLWARRGGFYDSQGGIGRYETSGYVRILTSGQPWPMAVASDNYYAYYPVNAGGIRKIGLFGSEGPITLNPANGGNSAEGLVVDDTHVYWGETSNATIYRVPKEGGSTEAVVFQNAFVVRGMAIDDEAIYYVTDGSAGGTVMKLAK